MQSRTAECNIELMKNTSRALAPLPEYTAWLKLTIQPLLQPTAVEPGLAITGQRRQQEVTELARSAELVDAAWRHAEDFRHLLDGADGRQGIADADDLVRAVETAAVRLRLARFVYLDVPSGHALNALRAATTRLRLHTLVLRDAIESHQATA